MTVSRESYWKKKFCGLANKLVFGFHAMNIPTAGMFNAGPGTPDVLACYKGQLIWIEFKLLPNKLSDRQEMFMKDLSNGEWFWLVEVSKDEKTIYLTVEDKHTVTCLSERTDQLREWVEGDFSSYLEQKWESSVLSNYANIQLFRKST